MKDQDVEKNFKGLILKEFPMHMKYIFLGVVVSQEKSITILVSNLV